MTSSTMTRTPGTPIAEVPGVGAVAETYGAVTPALLRRISDPEYWRWLDHISSAAGCTHPIRLFGRVHQVDPTTGAVLSTLDTTSLPDEVLYVPCGNRRSVVCPSCSATYRADTYQLVRAGLAGGKGVPDTVTGHPCVFVTLTAPSFGSVHSAGTTRAGKPRPCHPRRAADVCPHGVMLSCVAVHDAADPVVGTPLCARCYDYHGHVVFNAYAGELWRRTTITANRALAALGKRLGSRLRLSYAKVAEYQHRGLVHFHALIRLDGMDPDDPTAIVAPDPRVTVDQLTELVTTAAETTTFATPEHPKRREGWLLGWGPQLDVRTVQLAEHDVDDTGEITTTAVAAYLAKYATKATEATGYISARITPDTIRYYADPATHAGRVVRACWVLGRRPRAMATPEQRAAWKVNYGRLRRWAHMLGYGGHFSTKSRRYSTTLGALRQARRDWHRAQHQPPATGPATETGPVVDEDQAVTVADVVFAGMGWHTTADALLANSAAARAREHRQVAREELMSMS